MTEPNRREEIQRNLDFFLKELPTLPPQYQNKFAVLKNCEIVGYYDTPLAGC
jgi:hypothetical protein